MLCLIARIRSESEQKCIRHFQRHTKEKATLTGSLFCFSETLLNLWKQNTKQMKNSTKITLRLLMSPFLLCIILIRYNYTALKHTFLAVKYGGEWITYMDYDERNTIQDIYTEIKSQRTRI